MSAESRKPFLSRWSQRKLEASREAVARVEVPSVPPVSTAPAPASTTAGVQAPADPVVPELPPIESLSFDSDFTQFMQPKVDESLKRQALRKLFTDPRFNVMDGLDVYIDDYTKFVPMTPEILAQLNHAKFLFDPPKTRINAQGHAEDVPPEPESTGAENDIDEATQPESEAHAALPDRTDDVNDDKRLPEAPLEEQTAELVSTPPKQDS
jgi:hypothetical protein